ncbi:uncharacterized protein [Triticum aestivum]|uniref:uncharacterized protein n=1 Tax=Triticum aestivum TaxID=4565 RepID=UPI001D01BFAD|nr:uncharacterized protein LOC123112480 [Triticum aestivum]
MSLVRIVPANAGPYVVAPRATVVRFITLRSTVARPGLAGLSSQAHGRYLMCRAMAIKLISLIWNEWISVPSTCHTLQRHATVQTAWSSSCNKPFHLRTSKLAGSLKRWSRTKRPLQQQLDSIHAELDAVQSTPIHLLEQLSLFNMGLVPLGEQSLKFV